MSQPRYIEADEVRRLLSMTQCIAVMERAFAAYGRGDVLQPMRTVIHQPDGRGSLYVMPAYTVEPHALAVKVLTLFHENAGRGLPSHQGTVLAFDPETGALSALIDAESVTAIRTAAVSALATRILASPDAADLALLGSGVQAGSHLDAMRAVRPIERVRVWSPDATHRTTFADAMSERHGIPVVAVDGPDAAVQGADLICTLTAARQPILRADWIAPGAHVNAVGASTPSTREVETDVVLRARVFVDSRAAALGEAGDLLIPIQEGRADEGIIKAELAELVLGTAEGRRSADEITFFKSLGLALEDAAAAGWILSRA